MLFDTRMIWKSVHLVELEKEQNFKSVAVCLNIVVKTKEKALPCNHMHIKYRMFM